MIFISAPGGAGKTVSTLLWIKKSRRKAVWIGLDAYDNSISIFYKMLCTGILAAQPDNDRMTAILRNSSFSDSPVEHTIQLLAELISDGSEYILALDDFHNITNPEILKSLPYILRRLPHSFVTLILSRNEPDASLSEYAAHGQAAVIGIDDLSFHAEEIKEYFAAHGRGVSDSEVEAAFEFTGGWAIAVNILAQSSAPAPESFGKPVLDSYVKKHIWDKWDGELRKFLTECAAIDEMPVALCEKITGKSDAGELLEHLRAQNAFVARVGDGVYRYHRLFLDFIRAQPEYINADKKNLWRIAAIYYSEENDLIARRYAFDSGYISTILDVTYKFMKSNGHYMNDYVKVTQNLFFSPNIENLCGKCPVLYMSRAYVAFLTGDAQSFEINIDKLKRRLPEIIDKYSRFMEPALSIISFDYRTPFEQYAQADFYSPIVFKSDELEAPTKSLQMPFYHRGIRDLYRMTNTENYDRAKKIYKKLLKNHYEQIIHDINAGLFLEQNRVHDALAEAQSAVVRLAGSTTKELRFIANIQLAAVYLAMDKKSELAALIKETERFIDENARFLRPNFLAFTTRAKLWNGDVSAAKEWFRHYFVTETAMLEPYRIYQYFTTVRAYAVLGELEKAKDLAVRLRKMGEDFRRPQDTAEAGVLLAAVLWAEGGKDEAREIMETVLSEMQPYSFIRLIADEGAAVLPILKKVSGKTERADYKGLLAPAYVNSVYIAAYTVSKQRKGIMAECETKPVKLSKQQKMIVQFLAQGYKRESIIEKTGLSLGTVKSHTRIAYEKLGAGTAADAVVKARELGIID